MRVIRPALNSIIGTLILLSLVGQSFASAQTKSTISAQTGSSASTRAQSTLNSTDKVGLGAVVQAIEDALTESEKYEVPGFPPFQSATVTAATTVEKQGTGQLKLLVFNLGGGKTVDNAMTMTLGLEPPSPPKGSKVQSFNPVDIKNALVKMIVAAKLGFVSANSATRALQTDTVDVQIEFKVTAQGTGGVDTGSILPVGISVAGKYSRAVGNTIKLVFSDKAK